MSAYMTTPEITDELYSLRRVIWRGIAAVPLLGIAGLIGMVLFDSADVGRGAGAVLIVVALVTARRVRRRLDLEARLAQRMVADPTHLSDFHRAMSSSMLPPPLNIRKRAGQ